MRLQNYTKLDNERLKEIIRFVKPGNVSNFDIAFKNSRQWRGYAAYEGCVYHARSMKRKTGVYRMVPFITIGVPPITRYIRPHEFKKGDGYLGGVAYSHEEALVLLIAHESRHLWQAKVKRGYRVWGARGQFSERDCDAYAIQMLRRWRRK